MTTSEQTSSGSPMDHILEGNRRWAEKQVADDPEFFKRQLEGQQPRYLYIGCADSRVPAALVTGTGPGEVFTHRNIANLVVPGDLNLLSVLQYAVEVLQVKAVMVVGHYGCGGVAAAASNHQYGLIDSWLSNIRDVIRLHQAELNAIEKETDRLRRLVQLNVIEQVRHLAQTNVIQNAYKRGNPPTLHGLVYDIGTGRLEDLNLPVDGQDEFSALYQRDHFALTAGSRVLLEQLGLQQRKEQEQEQAASAAQQEANHPLAPGMSEEEQADEAFNSDSK